LQAAITLKAVAFVLSIKMQEHIKDSQASKMLCQVRGGNAQFGNRYKNRYEFKFEYCQHCETFGLHINLAESHVIIECPMVATPRSDES